MRADAVDIRNQSKWNSRYAFSGDSLPPPAAVLSRGAQWLPAIGDPAPVALDFACGRAANGEWLGARGFVAHAWDFSNKVIDDINARQHSHIHVAELRDVAAEPPEPASFDVIVVSRFLDRSLCPAISAALTLGGVLYYQTFTHGLSNPDYLLGEDELPGLFPSLELLDYLEPPPNKDGKAEAQLIARRITLDA